MRSRSQTEQAVRHAHAAAPDHGETAFSRDVDGFVRVGPRLEPEHLRADRDGVTCDRRGLPRWTEDVDDIDRHIHIGERRERAHAEDLVATRIDRDDPVPLRLEIARDVVRRHTHGCRGADDRDGLRLRKDAQQLFVGGSALRRIGHDSTVMDRASVDHLVSRGGTPAERTLLSRAIAELDEQHDLGRKIAREPELASILEEFIGRLQRAFGSLARVRGKRILDIASGSNSSRSPATGGRTAMFEPWFARLLLELGAEAVALDSGDLDGERFEHHRVDLGQPGALDFLAAASFDGVQDSRLFGSPEFRKAYPRRRDHERVKAEIARQERRVLKPDGVLIHSDN